MGLYQELPSAAQTAYSELYEATQQAELRRGIGSLNGSFQTKTLRGKRYWYFAYRDVLDGDVRQFYVGPDSPRMAALLSQSKDMPSATVTRQARAAVAHGCAVVAAKHFRIIRHLSDGRFFRAGGILIGSHAFIAIGNLLGVQWTSATHTQDIDFAHAGTGPSHLALALPGDIAMDMASTIDRLQMGFLPSLGFSGNPTGTYVSTKEPELRLDFLTPLRRDPNPVTLAQLKLTLQPIRFLDYLIQQPTQAALLSANHALVVSVPDPARFAMHKLLIAGERPISERTKSAKDITQASAVIAFMQDHQPADAMQEAATDMMARGPGWSSRLRRGIERMQKAYPDIGRRFVDETMNQTMHTQPSTPRGPRP